MLTYGIHVHTDPTRFLPSHGSYLDRHHSRSFVNFAASS